MDADNDSWVSTDYDNDVHDGGYVACGSRLGGGCAWEQVSKFSPDYDDYGWPLVRNHWYYFLVNVKPGLNKTGYIKIHQIDMETGDLFALGEYDNITFGYAYNDLGEEIGDFKFNWKVGTYRSSSSIVSRVYYDNIAYSTGWNNITKNRLTGYQKCVLSLGFDEAALLDNCWNYNGGTLGDPLTDYNNDGYLYSGSRVSGGVMGKCLSLNGTTNEHELTRIFLATENTPI